MIEVYDNLSESVNWSNPVNWSHPLNRDLLLWQLVVPNRMGWGSVTWRDMANHNHGTLTTMDPATDWRSDSVDFDGTNDYVNCGDIQIDGLTELYMSAVMQVRVADDYKAICGKESSTINRVGMTLAGASDGTNNDLMVLLANGANSGAYTTSNLLTVGATRHVAFSFRGQGSSNAERLHLYIDGVRQSERYFSTVPATTPTNSANFGIGFIGYRYFNGFIGSVRVASSFRNADEVRWEYELYRRNWPELLNRIWRPMASPQVAAASAAAFYFNRYVTSRA